MIVKAKWGVLAVAVASVAALAACSGQSSPSPGHGSGGSSAAEPGVTSYLCSFPTGAWLLQWTDTQGSLSGTYQTAEVTGSAPQEQVSTANGTLNGLVTGSALTLELSEYPTWYGNVSGTRVSLNVPQKDGSIQPMICGKSSVPDWNAALNTLNNQASNDNASVAQAQASASAAASEAQNQAQLVGDDQNLNSAVSGMNKDLGNWSTDMATANADYQKVLAEPLCQNGFADQNTYDDAQTVYDDGQAVYDDESSLTSDISAVQGYLGRVNSDLAAIGGTEGGTKWASDISTAQGAVSKAQAAVNANESTKIQSEATAIQTKTDSCGG